MAGFLNSLFDPSVLYDTLKEQNLLPEWAQTLPYDGGAGSYYPGTNRLVSSPVDNVPRRNTAAHEMTHAVQAQLLRATAADIAEKRWNKQAISPVEEQYLKAAQTMFANQYGRVGQFDRRQYDTDQTSLMNIVNGLYKSRGDKDYDEYRTTPTEAQAFGVGNMSVDDTFHSRSGGPHFDPTMATDFSVLLDLYKRLPQTLRDSSAEQSRKVYTHNRGLKDANKLGYEYPPPNYPNPFLKKMK